MEPGLNDSSENSNVLMIVEIIPFKSFKEKIRIVKQYMGKAKIEVYKHYIYIERNEDNESYNVNW